MRTNLDELKEDLAREILRYRIALVKGIGESLMGSHAEMLEIRDVRLERYGDMDTSTVVVKVGTTTVYLAFTEEMPKKAA